MKRQQKDMHLIPQHAIYYQSDGSELQRCRCVVLGQSRQHSCEGNAAHLDVYVNEGTVSDTMKRTK